VWNLGLAVLFLASVEGGAPASPTPAPAPLVTYRMVESSRSLSPAGERVSTLAATVSVSKGAARLEAATGTLPRTTATVALSGDDGLLLLDPKEKAVSRATPEQLEALFTGSAQGPGMGSVTYRDVEVVVSPEKPGKTFQGQPTRRYRVSVGWTLAVTMPGRVSHVRTRTSGHVDALEMDAGLSAFDDLTRLFGVDGEVRDALTAELAKVRGLPVSVQLETVSDLQAELVGAPSAEAPGAPPAAKTTITRVVSDLSRRPAAPADAALFRAPDDYRSRSLDRLLKDGALLP